MMKKFKFDLLLYDVPNASFYCFLPHRFHTFLILKSLNLWNMNGSIFYSLERILIIEISNCLNMIDFKMMKMLSQPYQKLKDSQESD